MSLFAVTAEPLEGGDLEQRAQDFLAAWKKRDHKAEDKCLVGLNEEDRSLVVRRAQRLSQSKES